ncbi:MAG: GntR family transcriptional regulator [Spirochaetota bacterium]
MTPFSEIRKKDINHTSLPRQVYSHIKRMIITQELKGGQRIPEESIARAFGVSRTPIREAMRELEKDGLIHIFPRKHAEVVQVGPEDKKRISELRIQLDTLSVRLLCGKMTEEQHAELKGIAEKGDAFAAEGNIARSFEMDSAFHCKMAEFSGNDYLYNFVKTLDLKVQLIRNIVPLDLDEIREGISVHTDIADLIFAGKCVEAEELVRKHLAEYYFND